MHRRDTPAAQMWGKANFETRTVPNNAEQSKAKQSTQAGFEAVKLLHRTSPGQDTPAERLAWTLPCVVRGSMRPTCEDRRLETTQTTAGRLKFSTEKGPTTANNTRTVYNGCNSSSMQMQQALNATACATIHAATPPHASFKPSSNNAYTWVCHGLVHANRVCQRFFHTIPQTTPAHASLPNKVQQKQKIEKL